jgi:hypothetical protein
LRRHPTHLSHQTRQPGVRVYLFARRRRGGGGEAAREGIGEVGELGHLGGHLQEVRGAGAEQGAGLRLVAAGGCDGPEQMGDPLVTADGGQVGQHQGDVRPSDQAARRLQAVTGLEPQVRDVVAGASHGPDYGRGAANQQRR